MRARPGAAQAVLAAALLVGGAVRAERLGRAELTTDEAFSWRMSTYPARDIVARTAADVHPPLFYLLLRGWRSVWGESPSALRALSLVLGLAAIPLAWALARELDGGGSAGAAAAALLVAVHADQVGHSRAVRMYTVGIALAAASAWLLLRALRSGRRSLAWWTAYGVAAALLCYTHYYGAFTVAAQVLFALFDATRRRGEGPGARRRLAGVAAAVAVVVALFAPWLSVLRRQASRVSQDYWIRDEGPGALASALVRWAAGLDWWPSLPLALVAGACLAAGWSLWRGDRGQRFLALQATLPWLFALGLSAAAGRPLVLERYLAFAQIALLVWVGRWWAGVRSFPGRAAAALAIGAALALGLAEEVGARPSGPPSAQEGARLLARSVAPGDLVLANAPRDLDVVRYYLDREAGQAIPVFCPASRSVGHLSQVSSVATSEVIDDGEVWSGAWPRVWRVRLHPPRKWRPEPPPPPWRVSFTRVFEGPASTRLYVEAAERR